MKKLNLLLIGLGQMGKIHKRVLDENNDTNLVGVVDSSFEKKYEIKDGVKYFNKIKDVDFEKCEVDAVIISSTTKSHYEIANRLINKNIPLLIEKPLSTDIVEVNKILDTAIKNDVVIRCGLIETYNPIFKYLKNINLKNIISINIFRHSPKVDKNRKLDNVLFDLTLHDIAVLGYLFNNPELSSVNSNFGINENSNESVNILCSFEGTNVMISTSRESQLKIRTWEILTKNNLYKIDLMQKNIHVFDSGFTNSPDVNNLVTSNANYKSISFVNHPETAQIQLNSFIENIKQNELDLDHIENVKYSHENIYNIFSS